MGSMNAALVFGVTADSHFPRSAALALLLSAAVHHLVELGSGLFREADEN
jgi:hypothetical protein